MTIAPLDRLLDATVSQRIESVMACLRLPALLTSRRSNTVIMIHRSPPTPGEYAASDSGECAVQPKFGAPPGVRNPKSKINPPSRNNQ